MNRFHFLRTLLWMAFLAGGLYSFAVPAEENAPNPGHSVHGEAFDDGPRQAARLMGGTGQPGFPVTTKQPPAQAFIDQGVGQLSR